MDKIILTTSAELAALIKSAVTTALMEYNKPAETERKFLSIDDACKYLNLAKQTLYGHTSKNTIPFIKRGKKLYFKKEDLEKWLLGTKND